MTSILIRCDASLSIGSGHVMRCRTLARELQRRGAQVTFICRRQPGDLIVLLEQEFEVLPLPELPLLATEELAGRELYRAWLGCSEAQDAADSLQALSSAGIERTDWLVVDHYGLDASWESLILEGQNGETSPKLLVIDDLADRPHKANLLLDQNYFGKTTEHRYEELVPRQCRQLLGPHHALLGPEYAQLHPLVPVRKELRRLLVFFGGVDPDNLTARTIKALLDPALAHLAVDVVLGRQSPHRQEVSDLIAQHPLATMHNLMPSLAGLIARADLAIGAGGATTWERACLKLPSLVVAVADNQRPFSEALHQEGHIQLLGNAATVSIEKIRTALNAWLANPLQQDGGWELTDGIGALRLALAMLGPQRPIRLRPAGVGDEALLLRWANDPQVRSNSFSQDQIGRSDHHEWFLQGMADPNRLLMIATAADGCPIGQIRFDRQPFPAEDGSTEATIDISLDQCARGLGLSSDLIHLGLEEMKKTWGPDIVAVAEVLTGNPASNACFKRANFIQEPRSPVFTNERLVNRWRCRRAT